MSGPHDALFKATFDSPVHAAGLLRAALPTEVLAALDLATLRRVAATFVDDALTELRSDVLFAVDALDGQTVYVYLLLEHQSTVDALMPLRVLGYEVRIWEEHVRLHGKAFPLPPIASIVVSHASGGWSAATRFEQLVALDGPRAVLAPFTPSFGFALDDLRAVPDAELLARTATAAARAVLLALKHAETDPVGALEGVLDLLRDVLAAADGERVLSALVHYTLRTGAEPARIFELAGKIDARVVTMAMTAADKLIQQGLERGRQEGRQEGRQAQREILLRLLAHRFGALEEGVVARVNAASEEDLGRWAERLLDVATVSEVFGA